MILEKNILQASMHKKKILHKAIVPKKNSRTYSGLEKKFWQDVPCADSELLYQQTVKSFLTHSPDQEFIKLLMSEATHETALSRCNI